MRRIGGMVLMHTQHTSKQLRRAARNAELANLREGRRNRAATFIDRKKEASRKACRKRHTKDW